jgi:hypothetical protein
MFTRQREAADRLAALPAWFLATGGLNEKISLHHSVNDGSGNSVDGLSRV